MNSEWNMVRLVDVASIRNGAGVKQEFFADHGTPLARVTNFTDSSIDLEDSVKVHPGHANRWKHHRLDAGDALVATVGSWPPNWASVVGKAVLVPNTAAGAIQNQNTCCIRALSGKANQRFVYYTLKSEEFAHYAANSASGSANQARLPVSKLEEFTFNLPPLKEQQSIAGLLGSLDDRITHLRETNATLEAIAQALFKSWFVDFDPVRAKMEGRTPEGMDEATAALFPDGFEESALGLVPRGWRFMPIGEAVESVGGATPDTKNSAYWEPAIHCWTTPKDLSGIPSPVLLDTERKLSDEGLAKIGSGLLPVGTLLLSSRAPIGYLALAQVPLAINQGYIAMLAGGLLPPLFMLFWCQQNMETIKGRANGSTFMEISKKAFRPIPALVPPPEVVAVFIDIAESMFARLVENEKQAQTLATLRDTLLPRLISGQLRLPEVTVKLEESAA